MEKARKIIINHILQQDDIIKERVPNVTLEELGESSVTIKIMFWINIFKSPKKDQTLLGEPIKSRIMREVKDLLLEKGFSMPAQIIEHKMYKDESPLNVKVLE